MTNILKKIEMYLKKKQGKKRKKHAKHKKFSNRLFRFFGGFANPFLREKFVGVSVPIIAVKVSFFANASCSVVTHVAGWHRSASETSDI
jgi:hypothetical protein